jgi:DNA (cytosine-5)-methyltransferase 1
LSAYYNEHDPFAAQWLRELIKAGMIAPGDVDERSIEDVTPTELMGYTQCHFFAGIGVWSYALRQAGLPDDQPVWTGSCPCQPFSSAGKGAGFDDERHLWPSFQWLIQQCRPAIVLGEQVASKNAEPWIDLVQADLEAMGYAFGCVAFPASGVGAPHIRDRAYWVGNALGQGLEGLAGDDRAARWQGPERPVAEAGLSCRMADKHSNRCNQTRQRIASTGSDGIERDCRVSGMADTAGDGCQRQSEARQIEEGREPRSDAVRQLSMGSERHADTDRPGPTNGFWRAADWVFCRDNKWRPVEPGVSPLDSSATNRVGRLRGYGNAINAEAAKAFIECVMKGEA